jgi:hypothetical protein
LIRLTLFVIVIFLAITNVPAQVETIPADHQVYPFLKNMFVKGALKTYDDVVLPLSKEKVSAYLKEIETNRYLLTDVENEFLCRMETKLGIKASAGSYLDQFPSGFIKNYRKYNEKHLYFYRDSVLNFNVDLLGDVTYIYSHQYNDYSTLLNAGGQIYGSYSNWLGFLLEGSNGTQYHNRQVASLDPRVKNSFTFNHTGINFFDYTQGYIRIQKADVSLELGRERVLWGNGYVNRLILSDNPPLFDFLKFGIRYKFLSYDFMHAWLVQPYETIHVDSMTGDIRQKGSKYLAVSRLGINPFPELKLGLSQMIIYANRPFEASYLNPFLFWESAQRSLGDLDNSFLAFDASYKVFDGTEISVSAVFDDILYSALFKGKFDQVDNRSAWQAGVMLTDPVLPSNTTLKLEYLQIRPYTFSHPGIGESLTYTNNSYILGTNIQPNSAMVSVEINYIFPRQWEAGITWSHLLHGKNIYDNNGKLLRNVGGNIFENLTLYDSRTAPLLDGDLEKTDNIQLSVRNEIIYGVYLSVIVNKSYTSSGSLSSSDYKIYSQVRFYFR